MTIQNSEPEISIGERFPQNPCKLIVIIGRTAPMQFRVERSVSIIGGDTTNLTGGKLQIACPLLSNPEGFLSYNGRKWQYTNYAFDHSVTLCRKNLTQQKAEDLMDGDCITIQINTWTIRIIFREQYIDNVAWKKLLLNDKKNGLTLYSEDSVYQMNEDGIVTEEEKRSAHQAHFAWKDNSWYVQDINTTDGIYINRKRVRNEDKIQPGDMIHIGSTFFLVEKKELLYNHLTAAADRLSIHIEEKTVWSFFRKKVLLKDINLNIDPGSMVLLLGGSGAGKTTFINAVTGYEKAKATILSGGLDVYANYDRMKYEIGMVPQQDLLRGEDNVRKTLENAAEMRMPAEIPAEDRKKRVDQVLELLGLHDQAEERVDKLSGGQRKRLSIAVEYIANPSLFILDEPDSGLDGVMARDLMVLLRKIANQNKIVLVITHTPDRVVDLFDKVIVLAKNNQGVGEMAYYGTIENARRFFQVQNMESIIRLVSSREEGGDGRADEFISRYRQLHAHDLDENGQDDELDAKEAEI